MIVKIIVDKLITVYKLMFCKDKMEVKAPKVMGADKIMCKAAEVGKIVINKCLKEKIFIDTQKLQKLLVLMQVECIKLTGKALFYEEIRIWNCGVAIKEVDEEFRGVGDAFHTPQVEYINLLDAENQSVNSVIKKYGSLNAAQLNDIDINQKIISLGKSVDRGTVPHVDVNTLIEEFFNQ